MRALTTIVIALMIFVPTAFAQTDGQPEKKEVKKYYLYEWTDRTGGVHITDDLGEVPEQYRSKARTIEIPKGEEVGPAQQTPGASAPGISTEGQDAASKAAWQRRLRDWKGRLADAQGRYQALDQKRLESLGKWRGADSGHREGLVEADRIQQEMKEVQKEIDEAKDMIETVIPEEARRAGIPPGWLRE